MFEILAVFFVTKFVITQRHQRRETTPKGVAKISVIQVVYATESQSHLAVVDYRLGHRPIGNWVSKHWLLHFLEFLEIPWFLLYQVVLRNLSNLKTKYIRKTDRKLFLFSW